MTKYWTCNACFPDAIDAGKIIGELAAHGIAATQFPDVKDIVPNTVFYALWRATDSDQDDFEATVDGIFESSRGDADCFGLMDRRPIVSDFYRNGEKETDQ